MHCQKCSGERRVILPDNDSHWHWEACPDCNGFEEMALTGGATCDNFGDVSPSALAVDAEINDDLPW